MDTSAIDALFLSTFGSPAAAVNFTPGRVNLIGEHTDYNGGRVLPTALEIGVSIALSPRSDDLIRIWSDKFDQIAERSLSDTAQNHWSDYITGALVHAKDAGLISGGADIAVTTTLPFGAGISSSAAVTVGVLKLTRTLSGVKIQDEDIARLARKVENDFIGMPCGIMDQMAVAIARPGQALALDTETLEYSLVDIPSDYQMVVVHSGQYRQLSEGRYKERKEECDRVKAALGHANICQISDADFSALSTLSDMHIRRAKHCMSEHRRTVEATACLQSGDIKKFGELMNASHISMRDDFEISLPAIDTLVEDAVKFGAVGARLTGGGFGGCIVACVPKHAVEDWTKQLISAHPHAHFVA